MQDFFGHFGSFSESFLNSCIEFLHESCTQVQALDLGSCSPRAIPGRIQGLEIATYVQGRESLLGVAEKLAGLNLKVQALLPLFTQPAHLSRVVGHCVEKVGESAVPWSRNRGAWTLYQVGMRRGECQPRSLP